MRDAVCRAASRYTKQKWSNLLRNEKDNVAAWQKWSAAGIRRSAAAESPTAEPVTEPAAAEPAAEPSKESQQ